MSPISFLLVLGLVFWNFPKYDTAINNNVIRVCTADDKDHENCLANKKIADGEGLNPSIECLQLKSNDRDTYQCLDEVYLGENSTIRADVTFISSDEIYTAAKSNLTLTHLSNKWVKTALVVNSFQVKNPFDLMGKRGCFPRFMDAGYLSLAYNLNDIMNITDTCMFDVRLTEYVGPACTPGFQDELSKTNVHISDPFQEQGPCSLCFPTSSAFDGATASQCNYNTTVNLYAGREGALSCLSHHRGHFAPITVDDNTILPNEMKVMCKNGTLSDTLDIDEGCYLMEMPSEAIAIRADNPRLAAIQETMGRVMNASRTVRGEFIQIPKGGFENNERPGKFMKFFNSIDECPQPKEKSQGQSGQIPIIVGVVLIIVGVLGYYCYRRYKKGATSSNADLEGPEGPKVVINPEEVPLTQTSQL